MAPIDQSLTTPYSCPNKTGCGKSFASQAELSEHLRPRFGSVDSLKLYFSVARYGPMCLTCSADTSLLDPSKTINEAFAEGIELQKRLTGKSDGIAQCVAEFVTREDHDAIGICIWCG